MRFMLESHPELIFSKRTNLWPKYYQKFGPLEEDGNLNNCLNALAKNKHILALSPDFDLLRAEFRQGLATYERLFELIHQQSAEKHGKKYWGDQSEYLEFYALIVLETYPNAKFIHLIRDPRDRFAAILEKPASRQGLGFATARWLNSAKLAQDNLAAFPDRYLIIRYETMVADPEGTMIEVCDFLGLEFMPSMVKLDQIPRFENQPSSESPITDKYIGQFRKDLSTVQTAFIEKFSQKVMSRFQYMCVNPQTTGRKWVAEYLMIWPVNLLQMLTWRVLTQVGRV